MYMKLGNKRSGIKMLLMVVAMGLAFTLVGCCPGGACPSALATQLLGSGNCPNGNCPNATSSCPSGNCPLNSSLSSQLPGA